MTKKCILCFILISISLIAVSQNNALQGLKDNNGDLFFEWAGYDFLIKEIKTPKNEKDITKLKKKFKIKDKDIIDEYSISEIGRNNRIIITEKELETNNIPSGIREYKLYFIFEKNDKHTDLVLVSKLGERDIDLEHKLIELYLSEVLFEYIDQGEVNTINFIGRTLQLGNLCRWMSPNSINCKGGQISWSVFDSYQKAESDNNTRIKVNNSKLNLILDDSYIDILFEGQPIQARRIIYRPLQSRFPLAVYYVVSEVRGHFVSSILSHYVYNKTIMICPIC